jgi:hypothetical protein
MGGEMTRDEMEAAADVLSRLITKMNYAEVR